MTVGTAATRIRSSVTTLGLAHTLHDPTLSVRTLFIRSGRECPDERTGLRITSRRRRGTTRQAATDRVHPVAKA